MPQIPVSAANDMLTLDYVTGVRTDERLQPEAIARAKTKLTSLGLDDRDLMAWKVTSQNPDDPKSVLARNKIFVKIANSRSPTNEQAVDTSHRMVIKNLLDGDSALAKKYLESKNYDVKVIPQEEVRSTVGSRSGILGQEVQTAYKPPDVLMVRDKESNQWGVVDPQLIDFFDYVNFKEHATDLFDVGSDIAEGVVTGTAMGVGAALSPFSGGGSLAVGAAASGLASGVFDQAKQWIANAVGARDDIDYGQTAFKTGLGFAAPLVFGLGGKLIGFADDVAGWGFKKANMANLKQNAKEISEASGRLGIKPSPGTLYQNKWIQNTDSSLSQKAGKFGGWQRRNQLDANRQAVQKNVDEILADAGESEAASAGQRVTSALQNKVDDAFEQTKVAYENIRGTFGKNPVDVSDVMQHLDEIPAKTTAAKNIVKRLKKEVEGLKTVDDVMEYRTQLGETMDQFPTKFEKKVLDRLYGPLTRARDRGIGDQKALAQLKEADQIYAKTTRDIAEITNQKSKGGSAQSLLERFADKTPENQIKTVIRSGDIRSLQKLADEYPEAFAEARAYRIREISQMATQQSAKSGNVAYNLAKIINKMPKAEKALIFGDDAVQKADDLLLYLRETPEKLGPSGTPEGQIGMRDLGIFDYNYWNDQVSSLIQTTALGILTNRGPVKAVSRGLQSPLTTGIYLGTKPGLLTPNFTPLRARDSEGLRTPGGQ